jgi:spore maturation protein CgeB
MTRVGVIGPTGHDLFADNILDCLPDVGTEAVSLGMPRHEFQNSKLMMAQELAGRAIPRLDEKAGIALGRRAIEAGCDVVINVYGELMPEAVRTMRSAGIKVVLWFPDAVSNLGRQIMFIGPYSKLFFKDPLVVHRLAASYGLPVSYLPEACNPGRHRSEMAPGTRDVITTAGNMYPTRAILFDRLLGHGVPLELLGATPASWLGDRPSTKLHQRRYIFGQEKADTFRTARAVMNNLHPSEMTSVNCRLFEAAGSGGAVLCENRPALAELFEPGKEVLAFSDYDELLSHIKAVREDPGVTRDVGDAAARRAHAEHTYQHRLRQILEDVA